MKITAIIPTHRPVEFVAVALASIAAQDRLPDEVIVVDDSGENRLTAIRETARQQGLNEVQVLRNNRSKGASGARNAGVQQSSCDLVAFLDDDDEWLPSYLTEALERFERAQLDVLCTDLVYRFADESESEGKTAPDVILPEMFLSTNPGLIGSNCIIRRSLYIAIEGFEESLQTCEDMDFGIRLSLFGDVRYGRLPKRLVRHYHHNGPRLCSPRNEAMRAGVGQFWNLHSHRMSETDQTNFRRLVRKLWGVDVEGNFV